MTKPSIKAARYALLLGLPLNTVLIYLVWNLWAEPAFGLPHMQWWVAFVLALWRTKVSLLPDITDDIRRIAEALENGIRARR